MVRKLKNEQYKKLQRYAVLTNYNPDATRCNAVDVVVNGVKYSLTICFNWRKRQACICEVFKIKKELQNKDGRVWTAETRGDEITDEKLINACFDRLLETAQEVKLEDKDGLFEFYKKEVEPSIKCCSLNQ